jgi:hypothetical protein
VNVVFSNALAVHAAHLVRYIGLVDTSGKELSGSGYRRQQVAWHPPQKGTIRPTEDLFFDVPNDVTIGGWRGYDTIAGGTDYGGHTLKVEGPGTEFRLIAADTGIVLRGS